MQIKGKFFNKRGLCMCCARRGCRILLEYCVGNSNVEKRYPSVAGSENAAVSGLAPRATESCQTAFGQIPSRGRGLNDCAGWISAVPVSGTDREKRTLGSSKFMPKAKRQILIRVIK